MEGYKTYSGAFIMLISGVAGMLGMQDIISNEEISTFIAGVGGFIGFVITIYGRYKAKLK